VGWGMDLGLQSKVGELAMAHDCLFSESGIMLLGGSFLELGQEAFWAEPYSACFSGEVVLYTPVYYVLHTPLLCDGNNR